MPRPLAALLLLLLPAPACAAPRPLVFTHVTVIDGTGSPAQPDRTVVVTGNRISAVGPAGKLAIPKGARVVDAAGKFLIPGLWDMHAHTLFQDPAWGDGLKDYFPLFVANGVTGVREMHSFMSGKQIAQLRKELADGKRLGPRIMSASRIVDGPNPMWPHSLSVSTEAEGRRAVRSLKEEGFDFVKVYSFLPREAYWGIVREAKKQGMPVAGHVPLPISAAEASDAGQKSIEHLNGVLEGCSTRFSQIMKEYRLLVQDREAVKDYLAHRRRRLELILDTYDASGGPALFKRFVANGTWHTPTLTVLRAFANVGNADFFYADARLKYIPPRVRATFDPKSDFRAKGMTKGDMAIRKRLFQKQLEVVGAMRRAGVKFLAGTDAIDMNCFPGFSLHDELELLVTKCGFTPMEALQTATRNPAEYLGRLKDLGTVEPGKLADLVLLDANPLDDIRNTTKIQAVVINGKLLPRTRLQAMLDKVEADCKEQAQAPQPSAAVPARPIELSLDAREAPRKLLHACLVIPARPGPLTLYYPKWIPGTHQPGGPINDLSGLKITAGSRPSAWQRDDVDLYAFHCTVPEGADSVEVTLDYLGSTAAGAAMTTKLAVIDWHVALLYPKGRPVREQPVRASLTLPAGWKAGTALPVESIKGPVMQFEPVSLETLVDSPVLCGSHFKEVPLGPPEGPPHLLVLACDGADGLELSPALKRLHERLVAEAGALFGARHYRAYHFLLALSDHIGPGGLEHHESSDNRAPERMLVDDTYRKQWMAWLLAHEYAHSWNGKYRRPVGLATPDYQEPMRTRLLWVYEGLTEYLGFVLAARSSLTSPELSRDNLAVTAEWVRNQRGRSWRSREDTAAAVPHLYDSHADWASRKRRGDYYDEGALVWLEADTLIRQRSGGKKSLDDFVGRFAAARTVCPPSSPTRLMTWCKR